MPALDLQHCRLHYRLDGPSNAPLLVLSNSLGTDLSLWDAQVPVFTRSFRVLRYDTRGHGRSSIGIAQNGQQTPYVLHCSEPTTMLSLAADVIALADQVGADRFFFCGISLGGMTGLQLALTHPERLHGLVLANTAARIGSHESWNSRIAAVQSHGMQSIVEAVIERWFTPGFRSKHGDIVDQFRQSFTNTSPEGYIQCCEALRDTDLCESISAIRTPTLVIAGSHDPVTSTEDARFLADKIAGCGYAELAASHLSNVEAPQEFSQAVMSFFQPIGQYSKGMAVRRDVLGAAHVDRTLANLNDFNRDFQDLITRYAWGEIWTRPGLPRHTRSLVTLAMMVALNRADEFRMHVRAALNNGVSREEIKDLLLQTAIYCGVPAANAAFHAAQQVFAEMEQTKEDS